MSLLLNCQSLVKAFGAAPLFENVSFAIHEGDRLGLIGPNGAGKSTLLQILAGVQEPDGGSCPLRKGVRLAYVPQDSRFPPEASVRAVLEEALRGEGLDEAECSGRVATALGLGGFPQEEAVTATLSGGWRRRLAIVRALVRRPDILLLDEPTNHLDLEGILWLEKLLQSARFAFVVISHDRYFLENVATSMAELNRTYSGGLFRVEGNYSRFLERREEYLSAQAQYQDALENKVKREIEWLRRGPKARTSKSRARIDSAGRLIDELADVSARTRSATAQLDFAGSGRRTKRLIEVEGLSKSLGGRTLFRDLDLVLSPGMRLGLVGLNGTGKTTLLRLLTGEAQPDAGSVRTADALQLVYFDQNRQQVDPEVSLRRALAPHGDSVIHGDRVVHVAAWAKRFLFRPEQLEVQVGRLSGGERARVLIARLMLQPADVLLLDEPTNDLDIPTLEILEETLTEFTGALVLVTHDRYMLDRVSTHVLGLDGAGGVEMYADYSQWEQAMAERQRKQAEAEKAAARAAAPSAVPQPARKRLSYKEAREWEGMEQRILEAETRLAACRAAMEDPEVVVDGERVQRCYQQLLEAQAEVDVLYARWAELEARQQ